MLISLDSFTAVDPQCIESMMLGEDRIFVRMYCGDLHEIDLESDDGAGFAEFKKLLDTVNIERRKTQ